MRLETDRLVIRDLADDDLPTIRAWLADEGFGRFGLGWTPQDAPRYLERCRERFAEGSRPGLVQLKETSEEIGTCGLLWQKVGGARDLEVAYRLMGAYHGCGYGTEAARAVRDYGFRTYPVRRLISIVALANHPSARVAEKNGMRVVGTARFHDQRVRIHAITREEWSALTGGV